MAFTGNLISQNSVAGSGSVAATTEAHPTPTVGNVGVQTAQTNNPVSQGSGRYVGSSGSRTELSPDTKYGTSSTPIRGNVVATTVTGEHYTPSKNAIAVTTLKSQQNAGLLKQVERDFRANTDEFTNSQRIVANSYIRKNPNATLRDVVRYVIDNSPEIPVTVDAPGQLPKVKTPVQETSKTEITPVQNAGYLSEYQSQAVKTPASTSSSDSFVQSSKPTNIRKPTANAKPKTQGTGTFVTGGALKKKKRKRGFELYE